MMRRQKKENYWVSLSDMMTGLMVIFMFIAIAYIFQVKQEQKEKDDIIKEYRDTRIDLYKALLTEFDEELNKNGNSTWNAILSEDLSIRFTNEEVLFDFNEASIKKEFELILKDFFPRYLAILLDEKYRDKIAEVRIEGHTDSKGSYMYNVNLSQNRTANVLGFLFFSNQSLYAKLNKHDQSLVRYWFTANGFSYGRTVDKNGELTINSSQTEDPDRSRRVEFRIITKSEEVVKQIIRKLEEEGGF